MMTGNAMQKGKPEAVAGYTGKRGGRVAQGGQEVGYRASMSSSVKWVCNSAHLTRRANGYYMLNPELMGSQCALEWGHPMSPSLVWEKHPAT